MTREIDPRLADSDAARMLATALSRASTERGLSLRKVAPLVGYKQAVVLSHMATGRVPIPFDKVEKIAEVLDMDAASFLKAVLEQRHPEVSWSLLSDPAAEPTLTFEEGLAAGLGDRTGALNEEQIAVMREMAADPHPRRRWLNPEEAAAIEALRTTKPHSAVSGKPVRDYPRVRDRRRSERDPNPQ